MSASRTTVRSGLGRDLRIVIVAVCGVAMAGEGKAQGFVQVTDPANDVVALGAVPNGTYRGASWVDVDNDGWLDLHVSGRPLFRNTRDGSFQADSLAIEPQATPLGNTWADVDNDGFIDVYVAGAQGVLYRNEGGVTFSRVTTGDIGDSLANRGFAAAFGDYDQDGRVDLVACHFVGGFAGAPNSNQLLHNDGQMNFTRVLTTPISADTSTYIIPSWIDWDLDGDLDLTIGRGPIATAGTDDFYRNRLVEDGAVGFEVADLGALSTDTRDGQSHSWVDYDNDGDLDVHITNYRAGTAGLVNDLYRNDNGVFVKMTSDDVGPLVLPQQVSTASCFEDFNNDGWIDFMVANDFFSRNKLYLNNADGTFTRLAGDPVNTDLGASYGVVAGDYDRDGDQDVYFSGDGGGARLYRNELAPKTNHWINLRLVGTLSNRSAVGAKVRAKATIAGQEVWQMRFVETQNGSPGSNSLNVFFGLGDAVNVDSLVVEWPSGIVQVIEGVAVDQFRDVVEPGATSVSESSTIPVQLSSPRPNPSRGGIAFSLTANQEGRVLVDVVDVGGRRVRTLWNGALEPGTRVLTWDGRDEEARLVAAGIYFVRSLGEGYSVSEKVVRVP